MSDPGDTPGPVPARAGLSGGLLTLVFVAVVAVGAVLVVLSGDTSTAEIGRRSPQVLVSGFDGEGFDLLNHVDQRRGPVLLNLWASWCEPCRREFPALSEFAASHPEVTVVGVAVRDREEDARTFAEEMDPTFLVAWDQDNAIRDAFPSFGLPTTYLIDAEGTVVDIIQAELTPARLSGVDFGSEA